MTDNLTRKDYERLLAKIAQDVFWKRVWAVVYAAWALIGLALLIQKDADYMQ